MKSSRSFVAHSTEISKAAYEKGFGSDQVLASIRDDLLKLGFEVEQGKRIAGKINRPVFFDEGGRPSLNYQVDAYQSSWRCGLEVEAGRGMQGGAFYRDLIQAMVMTGVDHLIVAVLNGYRFAQTGSRDFEKCVSIARALFGHSRIDIPFRLTVIGYGPELDDKTELG